jgi:hypothetical protein
VRFAMQTVRVVVVIPDLSFFIVSSLPVMTMHQVSACTIGVCGLQRDLTYKGRRERVGAWKVPNVSVWLLADESRWSDCMAGNGM